ncbi:IS1 family transposase [Enterobacter ludwigii]
MNSAISENGSKVYQRCDLCNSARKTICFSRSVELHEKVIGAFIEKYMLY